MRQPTLLFVHGWAFDSTVWRHLAAELDDVAIELADLGYFGAPRWPQPNGPVVAIGHSLGSLLLLRNLRQDCRALVAINGFDSFADRPGAAGVARRPLNRMLCRFAEAAPEVVAEFRRRCGEEVAPPIVDRPLLEAHLRLLRDGDERQRTAAWDGLLLSLQADDDPILPHGLREGAFATGRHLRRVRRADGGHCLPLTQPRWCADHIRGLLRELE